MVNLHLQICKKWWNLSKHSPSKADNKWWLKYALSYHCVNQILLLIMKTRNFDQDIKVNRSWKWDHGPVTCAILTCTQPGECLDQLSFFFRSRCTGYHKNLTLLRYSRACAQHSDFLNIVQLLIQNLLKHGYVAPKLKSSLLKLYGHLHNLINRNIHISNDIGSFTF